MEFLHRVNQDKFQQNERELEHRLDCIVQKSQEAAKFRRQKVPLGWDIWSVGMKKMINDGIREVEVVHAKSAHRGLPSDYKKILWNLWRHK